MAPVIYLLCAATSAACLLLLWRGWRTSRAPLLFWSGVCFAGLTASNLLLVVDKLVLRDDIDLTTLRLLVTLGSLVVFLAGLVWSDR